MLPSDKHCEKTSKMMIENVQLYNFSLFHKELYVWETICKLDTTTRVWFQLQEKF